MPLNMTAVKESLAPSQTTSNNRSNKPVSNNMKTMTFKPMSNLPQSAELDEYTQSMKAYLASIEKQPSTDHSGDERRSSNKENEKDHSPEFRWMDLAALRREYSNMSLNTAGVSKSRSSSSSGSKSNHRSSNGRHQLAHDHRHYYQQNEPTPGRKSSSVSLNKKKPSRN